MKILVYEHASGGGYAGQPIDLSVLSEGFGMMRCLAADLKAADHDVTVLLDARMSSFNPPLVADCIIPVFNAGEAQKLLSVASKNNDAVYLVAPETGQMLESLVLLVGQTGAVSLNCEASAVHRVADKALLHESLMESGLCLPKAMFFDENARLKDVKNAVKRDLNYPVVFKPVDGVSCAGLSVVKEENQIGKAIAKITSESPKKRFIVQELIGGEAVSVSLLCTGKHAMPISLNKQNVELAPPEATSSYHGGLVPFEHPLKREAFKTAEKTAASFPGLRGYVGVDLVLAKNAAYVVDVNARLTTSYVGLSEIAGFNVADALVNAVLNGKLPAPPKYSGSACFSKVESSKPSVNIFQKATYIRGVVSPPFPLGDKSKSISLVSGRGESIVEAELRFEEAKKRLLNIISGGK